MTLITYDFRTYDFRPEASDPLDLDDLCLHFGQSLDLQCGLSAESFQRRHLDMAV